MNIRLVGAESFHAARRTDKTKLIVAFRNFTNSHKYLQKKFSEVLETKNKAP